MGLMKRVAEHRADCGALPADLARELWESEANRHLIAEPKWLHGERPEHLPFRDQQAFLDRKRAAREAARERTAIQTEAASPVPSAEAAKSPRVLAAVGAPPLSDLSVDVLEFGDELPVRAADGWYRWGRSFYHLGQGPFASFGIEQAAKKPAKRQMMLF